MYLRDEDGAARYDTTPVGNLGSPEVGSGSHWIQPSIAWRAVHLTVCVCRISGELSSLLGSTGCNYLRPCLLPTHTDAKGHLRCCSTPEPPRCDLRIWHKAHGDKIFCRAGTILWDISSCARWVAKPDRYFGIFYQHCSLAHWFQCCTWDHLYLL